MNWSKNYHCKAFTSAALFSSAVILPAFLFIPIDTLSSISFFSILRSNKSFLITVGYVIASYELFIFIFSRFQKKRTYTQTNTQTNTQTHKHTNRLGQKTPLIKVSHSKQRPKVKHFLGIAINYIRCIRSLPCPPNALASAQDFLPFWLHWNDRPEGNKGN